MLIILFVEHESSYDSFHKNASRIFWSLGEVKMGDDSMPLPKMSYATTPLAKQADPNLQTLVFLTLLKLQQAHSLQLFGVGADGFAAQQSPMRILWDNQQRVGN